MQDFVSLLLGAAQVIVSVSLVVYVIDIHRKLVEIEDLKLRTAKSTRAFAFQFQFSSQMVRYMKSLEGELWRIVDPARAAGAPAPARAVSNALYDLRKGRQLIALFGEDFAEIESSLMDLSQLGDTDSFQAASETIRIRRAELDYGGLTKDQVARIERIMERWRLRLRQQGKIIVYAAHWTG